MKLMLSQVHGVITACTNIDNTAKILGCKASSLIEYLSKFTYKGRALSFDVIKQIPLSEGSSAFATLYTTQMCILEESGNVASIESSLKHSPITSNTPPSTAPCITTRAEIIRLRRQDAKRKATEDLPPPSSNQNHKLLIPDIGPKSLDLANTKESTQALAAEALSADTIGCSSTGQANANTKLYTRNDFTYDDFADVNFDFETNEFDTILSYLDPANNGSSQLQDPYTTKLPTQMAQDVGTQINYKNTALTDTNSQRQSWKFFPDPTMPPPKHLTTLRQHSKPLDATGNSQGGKTLKRL